MFLLRVCKPEAQMAAQAASGIPPGILQAVITGLSWEAAGFKHMGTTIAAATSRLRPAPGWPFSDPLRGLKPDSLV